MQTSSGTMVTRCLVYFHERRGSSIFIGNLHICTYTKLKHLGRMTLFKLHVCWPRRGFTMAEVKPHLAVIMNEVLQGIQGSEHVWPSKTCGETYGLNANTISKHTPSFKSLKLLVVDVCFQSSFNRFVLMTPYGSTDPRNGCRWRWSCTLQSFWGWRYFCGFAIPEFWSA